MRAQQAALKFLNTQMTAVRPDRDDELHHRPESAAGFHRRPRPAGRRSAEEDLDRRNGMANGSTGDDSEAIPAPPTRRTTPSSTSSTRTANWPRSKRPRKMLGQPAGKKGAGVLRQRHDQDRHGQPGATARHHQRGDPRQRGVLSDRCARPGGAGPAGRRHPGSQGGRGMYSGSSRGRRRAISRAQQETLYTLAADTGGKALLDNNDLSLGIVQAQKDDRQLLHPGLLQQPTARWTAATAGSR